MYEKANSADNGIPVGLIGPGRLRRLIVVHAFIIRTGSFYAAGIHRAFGNGSI